MENYSAFENLSFVFSETTILLTILGVIAAIMIRLNAAIPEEKQGWFYQLLRGVILLSSGGAMIVFIIRYSASLYRRFLLINQGDWTFALKFLGIALSIVIFLALLTIPIKHYFREIRKFYFNQIFGVFFFIFVVLFAYTICRFIIMTYQLGDGYSNIVLILSISIIPLSLMRIRERVLHKLFFPEEELIRRAGIYYPTEKDYRESIDLLSKSIEIYPTTEAYQKKAFFYSRLNEDALALENYSKALELSPKNPFLYKMSAELKVRLGDREGASTDLLMYSKLTEK